MDDHPPTLREKKYQASKAKALLAQFKQLAPATAATTALAEPSLAQKTAAFRRLVEAQIKIVRLT